MKTTESNKVLCEDECQIAYREHCPVGLLCCTLTAIWLIYILTGL